MLDAAVRQYLDYSTPPHPMGQRAELFWIKGLESGWLRCGRHSETPCQAEAALLIQGTPLLSCGCAMYRHSEAYRRDP